MTLNLEAIKARCEKATAGPWYRVNGDDGHCMSAVGVATVPQDGEHDFFDTGSCLRHRQTIALTLWQAPRVVDHESSVWHDDADFIAHARTDLPALVAEVERLRKDDVVKWAWVEAVQDELAAKNAELARMEAALAAARAALDGYKSPEAAHNLAMRAIEESHRANRAEAALKDCRAALDAAQGGG